jgi:hypothetical protein
MRKLFLSRRLVLVFALSLVAVVSVAAFAASGGGAQVAPVQAKFRGLSYEQWSARWWQWCLSLPADGHPLFETADCSAGQSGNVWFLGGTFISVENPDNPILIEGTATRDCTIPPGTALFFPILNVEASTLEGNGDTEQELRDYAVLNADHIIPGSLVCTIDGKPVRNLIDYRVESPGFIYGPLPENNIVGAPEGATSLAVSDGVFVMVQPLPAGKHKIHFEGVAMYTAADDGFDLIFSLDITYNITVKR